MKKRNKIILILLCSILAICTVSTAGVLIWKKTAEKAPVSEEVLIDGGEASVSDEAALRELFLKEEELVITLTEDITVDESLVVKGKKTLSGTGSIKMALYVMPYESLITVAENATLILDGVTVNGNGIANGVKVEKSANLTLLSGEVAWGNPYGIEVQGNAEIKGGTITDAIHTGIFIGTSGNVQMNAGNVKSAGYASTRISKGGYFGFSGDAILQNCGVYHIHNSGTSDVTGGVVRDSEYTLATTDGELNINYQGTDGGMIEWYNATGSGIYVGEGGSLNASGFYVHDVGYAGVNSGQGTGAINLSNCRFENTGNNALHIKMATAELKDIEIIKPGKHGVFVNSPTTTATIENLTVTEPAERGLHNAGGTVTAKNVTVTSPGTYGVSTGNSGKTAGSLIVENLTVTGAGSNPDNSQPAMNSYKSSLTVKGATITDSNNAGARVTDGGELTLKNVKIENTGSYGVYVVHNKSKATLENVSVANTGKHGVYVNNAGAKAEINKLTVTNAGERGIHNAGGTITAKNVTVTSSGLYGVSTGNYTDKETGKSTAGSVTIDKLTVTGSKGDSAVNSYKSALTITNGKITDSAKVGVRVTDGGTMKLTDVEITKTGYEGVLVSSEGKATLKNIVVTNAGKHGVYVYKAKSKADIDTLKVVESAERGLHNAGGTVNAKNVTITSSGLYGVSTGNFTDAEGKVTAGSVTIDNLTVTGAKGDSSVNSYKSVLTITNGKITDSAKVGARVTDGGELNLTNVEIENAGLHGVYVVNEGSVANIDKLTVTKTGADYNGIYVAGKGKANLSGLNTITDAGKDGICANGAGTVVSINKQEGATAKKDALTITTPVQRGIRNEGATITAANVTVTDPGTYGVSTAKSGGSAGSVEVDNLTVTGAGQTEKQPAVNAHNGSIMTVNGAKISDCKNAGARATQGATIVLNDVEITNVVSYGVFVQGTGSQGIIDTLTVLKTEDAEYSSERGIYNEGGTVEAKNVTIDSAKTYAVSTYRYKDADGNIIKGSVSIEDLTVTNSIASALHVNTSVLTVNGGTISDTTTHGALANYGGTLNLTDVTMDGVGKNAVYVDGATGETTANLTRVSITNAGLHGVYVNGSDAETYATDVTINTTNKYTLAGDTEYGDIRVSAGAYAEVEKANITGSKEYGIYVAGGGILNLTGVSSITDAKKAGVYVAVNSTANINAKQNETTKEYTGLDKVANNLTITGGERGIYNVGGTVTSYHVSVSNTSSYGVQTEYSGETIGSMKVNDLSVDGAKGTAAIYSKGSELTVTGATLTNSTGHGALINYGGILNLTDATIDVTGNAKNGIHLDGDTGASKAYLTDMTIKDAKQYGVHAYGKDGYIEIDGLKVVKSEKATYSSLRGIANKGATIVASDVEIDSAQDYSVSTYKSSDTAKGSLTINNLTVTNSLKTSVHVNESTLTINGAELSGFTKYGVVVYTGGVANLNDAAIDGTGEYGIYLESVYTDKISTLNMNGTSSISNVTEAGVYVQPNTVVNINNTSGTLTITDCENGIHNIGGIVNAKNVAIHDSGTYGIYVTSKGEASINGINNITNAGKHGVFADGAGAKININMQDGATPETDCLTITDATERGIHNAGGTITAKNVTVTAPGTYGVSTGNSGNTKGNVTVYNLTVTGAGKTTVQPAVNSFKSVLNVIGATITDSYGNGARVTDAGELNLTDVTITTTGKSDKALYDGILVNSAGVLNLNGTSSITNAEQHGIYVDVNSTANINVDGDEATDKLSITTCGGSGIYGRGGRVTAENVTVNSPKAYGVAIYRYYKDANNNVRGWASLKNLSVTGAKGTAALTANYSDVTVKGGVLQDSVGHGALVNYDGTLRLEDVTIKNIPNNKYAVYIDKASGTQKNASADLVNVIYVNCTTEVYTKN